MRKTIRTGACLLAVCLGVLAAVPPTGACGYGMPNPLVRFAQADRVVVGKVTLIEPRPLMVSLREGQGKITYIVGVVKVEETLRGERGLTHVRIGMLPNQVLPLGFEGCFFLIDHPQESFSLLDGGLYNLPIARAGNAGFSREMERYRRFGRLLDDPIRSLESGSKEDRFITATMLVTRFRTFQPSVHVGGKTEPVDALTSQLILRALADADWNCRPADFHLSPFQAFDRLGMTVRDGWNPTVSRGTEEWAAGARRWLRDNEDTFRIAALVRR